ncbi:MAG: EAL domain-containing protein [Patescibacteria group bacterium]|nr:EAL domain-containing protein [Patescibacteria group bacterium]
MGNSFFSLKIGPKFKKFLAFIEGPVLVLLIFIVDKILLWLNVDVPNMSIIYGAAVAFAAFVGGLYSGLASAAGAVLLSGFDLSLPGNFFYFERKAAVEIPILTWVFPILVILASLLKRHAESMVLAKRQAKVLEKYQEDIRNLFNHLPMLVVITNGPKHIYSMVNKKAEEVFGSLAMIGKDPQEAFPELKDQGQKLLEPMDRAFKSGREEILEQMPITKDWDDTGIAYEKYFRVYYRPIKDDSGKVTALMNAAWDITPEVEAKNKLETHKEELAKSQDRLRMILEGIEDAVVVQNADGRIAFANEAGAKIFGFSGIDGFLNAPAEIMWKKLEILDEAGQPLPWEKWPQNLALKGKVSDEITIQIVVKSIGEAYWVLAKSRPIYGKSGEILMVVSIFRNVTQLRQAQQEIQFYASHDILTGLPNRKTFEERLRRAMFFARKERHMAAIMLLDLDRFKNINDTSGHDLGDKVIAEVASRLKAAMRSDDVIARWGGDEFVVLLEKVAGIYDVSRAAEKISKALEPVIRIARHTLHVSTSIGIALFPQDGEDLQGLLKNADVALYRAKEKGRNRCQFYAQAMNFHASEKLHLENKLRQALEAGEFRLHYQPIIDIRTKALVGAEALLRWYHPNAGIFKPNRFINLAEEIGMIVPIGKWVLSQACLQNRLWQENGLDGLKVSVNLSPRQFLEDDLLNTVSQSLSRALLHPSALDLELTENIAMENIEATRRKLKELSSLGVSIIIDDFGMGYSSLSYLKNFPVSKLKIDKSFVRHSITDSQDAKIIRAIISMAESLHLKVIAEGVDSETQLGLLQSLGCHEAQGFFISRPLSSEAFLAWAKNRQVIQQRLPFAACDNVPDA